jgi:hypothetical protein
MVKLTKQSLARLKPRAKPHIEYDTDLIGFGAAVYPSGAKSWVCEYRPHGGGRGVAKKRVTLGKMSQLTSEQARKACRASISARRLRQSESVRRDRRSTCSTSSTSPGLESANNRKSWGLARFVPLSFSDRLRQYLGRARPRTPLLPLLGLSPDLRPARRRVNRGSSNPAVNGLQSLPEILEVEMPVNAAQWMVGGDVVVIGRTSRRTSRMKS